MPENLDKLEREVEALLASLADDLPVKPAAAVVHRVKAAVRHELNETWLAGQPDPAPSASALGRVQSAVHAELAQAAHALMVTPAAAAHEPSTRPWRHRWGPGLAALAVAAMIGICVGLIHYAGMPEPEPPASIEQTQARIACFAEVAEDLFTAEPVTTALRAELDTLEQSIAHWRPDELYDQAEHFDELMDALDELLARPAPAGSTLFTPPPSRGTFG